MKLATGLLTLAAVAVMASGTLAAELKSGLEPGKNIGAFYVVKCAGSEADGVKIGDNLCYRCKYGTQPMVMVFARTADDNLAKLTKQLSKAVEENSGKRLAAFVNLIGDDEAALQSAAKQFGAKAKADNVPIVVPDEFENGPTDYRINEEADVTVIIATGGKVVASHGVSKGGLDGKTIAAIIADVPKAL